MRKRWVFSVLILVVMICAVVALRPMIKKGGGIDYDAGSVQGAIEHTLTPNDSLASVHTYQQSYYRADRRPGSPIFTMLSGFFVFWIQKVFPNISVNESYRSIQYVNLFFFLMTIFLFALKISRNFSKISLYNGAVVSLILLCFALHPLSIWLAFAYVEEIYAVFFSMLAWTLVEFPKYRHFGYLFLAMAINCKLTVLSMAPLVLLEAQDSDAFSNTKKFLRNVGYSVLFTGFLIFLFFLPALASFSMDYKDALWQPDYGIKSTREGMQVGWWYARITIQWWVIILLFFIVAALRDGAQGAKQLKTFLLKCKNIPLSLKKYWDCYQAYAPSWLKNENIVIGAFLLLCVISGVITKILALFVFSIWWANTYVKAGNNLIKRRNLFLDTGLVLAVLLNIMIMMHAPTSRSFLYYSLLPGLALIVKKYRSLSFWTLTFLITFLPMFRYFHFTAKQFVIAEDGYYRALIEARTYDFNDTGFLTKKTTKTVDFPWTK